MIMDCTQFTFRKLLMSQRRLTAWMLVCVVLAGQPLWAADTPVEAIPSDASVVVRLKNPQASIGKVADIADIIQPAAKQGEPGGGAMVKLLAQGSIGQLI